MSLINYLFILYSFENAPWVCWIMKVLINYYTILIYFIHQLIYILI